MTTDKEALLAFYIWEETTGDRWIPHTKDQKYEKLFHVMAS